MKFLSTLKNSFMQCAGEVVFGLEDGTVSVFGLVLGMAATTSNLKTILLAGATSACANAVSMGAGAYLEGEVDRMSDPNAAHPLTRALWMLVAVFVAGAVPTLPFVFTPMGEARWISIGATLLLLAIAGLGVALVGHQKPWRNAIKTVLIGAAAGVAGVSIGYVLNSIIA